MSVSERMGMYSAAEACYIGPSTFYLAPLFRPDTSRKGNSMSRQSRPKIYSYGSRSSHIHRSQSFQHTQRATMTANILHVFYSHGRGSSS